MALCLVLTGCSGTIHPPANPIDPVTIYVPDYGRHSSVILPTKDGEYIEWSFGDWNWFALGHTKWYDAMGALFFSRQSTLGRRVIGDHPTEDQLKNDLGTDAMLRIEVSASSEQQLMAELRARYGSHIDTQIHSAYSGMDQVKDSESYFAFNNCNDVTAHWLREMGCEVDGLTVLSHFKLGSPR